MLRLQNWIRSGKEWLQVEEGRLVSVDARPSLCEALQA